MRGWVGGCVCVCACACSVRGSCSGKHATWGYEREAVYLGSNMCDSIQHQVQMWLSTSSPTMLPVGRDLVCSSAPKVLVGDDHRCSCCRS